MFYIDPNYSKNSSGARFFYSLEKKLSKMDGYSSTNYVSVLANISSPLKLFIKYKLLKKKIIVRVDGNYNYPITKGSIKASSPLIFLLFKIFYRLKFLRKYFKNLKRNSLILFFFNLQFNFKNYFKIALSSYVIYQSKFSRDCHLKVFPNKKYIIINNSSPWPENKYPFLKTKKKNNKSFLICTSFHNERPMKGFGDLLLDLSILRFEEESLDIKLFIFGYTPKKVIKTFQKDEILIDQLVQDNQDWISTFPTFKKFTKKLSKLIIQSDAYITYSQQDPCPNIVLEVLSHCVPIISCDSGGIPEIVGNCGEILSLQKSETNKFFNFNFEYGLKPPSRNTLLKSILKIKSDPELYRKQIRKDLKGKLSFNKIIFSYYQLIKELSS